MLPEKLRGIENLEHFKRETKAWKPLIIAYVGSVKFTKKA